jgi:ClpP class serine protease
MRRRYDKAGILALYPQAFLDLFVEADIHDVSTVDGNAVIEIRGPLEHHDDWWCDSYEGILDRVTEACSSDATTVILKLDSPGGELFGCFDAARAIRARCKAAGKRLVAYVDGCACSAAYALACAAEEIVISETAFAGSIGILISRVDVTARDARDGIGFALVASGKRKVDGHPHVALSKAELESMQGQCDSLAELFFELVASLRGIATDAVRSLEADVFHGPRAVAVGLADRVSSFDELLELLAKGTTMADDKKDEGEEEKPKPSSSQKDVDDARAALERAAADGDEKAQAALDVLNGDAEAEEPKADEDEEEEKEATASASTPRRAASSGSGVSADSAAGLARIVAKQGKRLEALERQKDALERSALLSARPDLGKELVEHLATMPYRDAKAIVDKMPKPHVPNKTDRAAGTVVGATRGATQTDPTTAPPSTSKTADELEFDRAFGTVGAESTGIRREGTSLIFDAAGAARARLANNGKAAKRGEEGAA